MYAYFIRLGLRISNAGGTGTTGGGGGGRDSPGWVRAWEQGLGISP